MYAQMDAPDAYDLAESTHGDPRAATVAAHVPSGEQQGRVVQPTAALPVPQLHSFAPPPLLPNSKRRKSFRDPLFFAAAVSSGSTSLASQRFSLHTSFQSFVQSVIPSL
jgi:hypothetical protein